MCLIIENKTKNKLLDLIDSKKIEEYIRENPDGFGITFFSKEKQYIKTEKGFGCCEFLEVLKIIEKLNYDYYVHFRKATVGKVCMSNVHPFDVMGDEQVYFMHNGTLPNFKFGQLDCNESDSKIFSEHIKDFLSRKQVSHIQEKCFKRYIEEKLGDGRAVLITSQYDLVLNEHLWFKKDNGLSFSKNVL